MSGTTTYRTSGTHTIIGVGGTETFIAKPTTPPITVTMNLAGLLTTYDITSDAGATVTVNQAVSVANVLDLTAAGGAIVLGTGVAGVDTVNTVLEGGGTFTTDGTLASLLNGSTITFGAGGGTSIVGTAGSLLDLSSAVVYSGFATSADEIDDMSLNFSNFTDYSISGTGTQTVTVTAGKHSFSFEVAGSGLVDGTYSTLTGGPLTLTSDGANGGILIAAVCFLAGTRLATPEGERAIETLRPGDLVATRTGGRDAFRPITWVGHKHMDTRLSDGALESYPIRIRAGAFADATPRRDLLVTAEHCLHVDGKLVPARMLVNGGSIVVDTGVTEYDYFHVELDRHEILLAEGLEAESYLDTGNRGNFANAALVALQPDFDIDLAHKSWADAAAPLATAREIVEPIWQRLRARAETLGFVASAGVDLVGEPALRVITEGGVELRPSLVEAGCFGFVVPARAGALRLVSRAARPADTVGPFVDDRRRLGVLVGRITAGVGRRAVGLDGHLHDPLLSGWHPREADAPGRWTDGDAILPALRGNDDRPVLLSVEILSAGPFQADGAKDGMHLAA